jgi:YesN/AraC family two-component response regulator
MKKNVHDSSVFAGRSRKRLVLKHVFKRSLKLIECYKAVEKKAKTKIDFVKEELTSKVTLLMDKHKLYKDTSISLDSLACDLCTNRTYMSKCFNQSFNKPFNAFMNEYRYNEITRLVVIHPYYNRHELAEQGGFRSVSTMIRVIKRTTGLCYKEWKLMVLRNENQNRSFN